MVIEVYIFPFLFYGKWVMFMKLYQLLYTIFHFSFVFRKSESPWKVHNYTSKLITNYCLFMMSYQKFELLSLFKKMEKKKKVVFLTGLNEKKKRIRDTVTNICNTIINSGAEYHKITLVDIWHQDGDFTLFKQKDFPKIIEAINNTPSLTHLQVYPKKKIVILFIVSIF